MIVAKAISSGLPMQIAVSMGMDVNNSLTATGTTQTDALEITGKDNVFTTVASGTGAKLYSAAGIGDDQTVFNGGANALKVYPDSGSKINNLAANAGMTLSTNTGVWFRRVSTTQWIGFLSA